MTETGNCAAKVSDSWQIASFIVETESFELKAQHRKLTMAQDLPQAIYTHTS